MADIIDFDGERLSRTPDFRAHLDAVEACSALRSYLLGDAPMSPDEAAEALETIRLFIPPVERTG